MKKSLLLLLTFVYLITVSGINIGMHYCGGKLRGVSFTKHHDENSCCSKKMKKSCCKQKAITVKINDNHNAAADLKVPNIKSIELFNSTFSQTTLNYKNIFCSSIILFNHAPPDLYKDPLYLQQSVLII
jgi:hypothetical protein